ncbi:MAG: dethiobiotin synthase [Gallionella sp.]|nr:dethiobiotin synthase [Gallionella sp.]
MSYFITGTDTNVGKTLVSCALLQGFAAQGLRVAGMKPVAAGCDQQGLNEDVEQLLAAGNLSLSREAVNPYCFAQAMAPHLAAQLSGVRIDLQRIALSCRLLSEQADIVIAEGVGGFAVPLNDEQDGADLACLLKLPVILVVGIRLGCLNHARLTADAIVRCGLELAGWVANCVDGSMSMQNENIAALQQRIRAPLLGVVPHYPVSPDARDVANLLDISLLNH